MVGLSNDEKNFEDMCNRLHKISACDRQTDRRTDILPRHSPRYAYASRGKNQDVERNICPIVEILLKTASPGKILEKWPNQQAWLGHQLFSEVGPAATNDVGIAA